MPDTAVNDFAAALTQISNFDLQETRTLKKFLDRYLKPTSFLKSYFFPTKPEDVFKTEKILMDYIKRSQKAAPFVISGAVLNNRDGFTTDEYAPSRICPGRETTLAQLKKRGFGEAIFSELSDAARAVLLDILDFQELSDQITRREEIMCSEVLRTNGCVMRHLDSSNPTGDAEVHTIRFYSEVANPQLYTPLKSWSDPTADIMGDLRLMRAPITRAGNPANIVLMSPDVAECILDNTKIAKLLEARRMEFGVIDPKELPVGTSHWGALNIGGAMMDLISYDKTYENDEGVDTPYLPAGTVIVTGQNCGRGMYGAVTQIEESDREYHTYEGIRVPKRLTDAVSDKKKLFLTARPLFVPVAKSGWTSATVLFNSGDYDVTGISVAEREDVMAAGQPEQVNDGKFTVTVQKSGQAAYVVDFKITGALTADQGDAPRVGKWMGACLTLAGIDDIATIGYGSNGTDFTLLEQDATIKDELKANSFMFYLDANEGRTVRYIRDENDVVYTLYFTSH